MKVGLFFGSFNPIHIGHLAIAGYMLEFTDLESIWFVVSPQNPFKKKSELLPARDRLHLVHLALNDHPGLAVCDAELRLPVPSFTIDTVTYLSEKNPRSEFVLLMGADCLASFHKWKNAERLQELCPRYVYPRPGYDPDPHQLPPGVHLVSAPLMEISSSFIRKSIAEGKDMTFFLPPQVYAYIQEMNYYRV